MKINLQFFSFREWRVEFTLDYITMITIFQLYKYSTGIGKRQKISFILWLHWTTFSLFTAEWTDKNSHSSICVHTFHSDNWVEFEMRKKRTHIERVERWQLPFIEIESCLFNFLTFSIEHSTHKCAAQIQHSRKKSSISRGLISSFSQSYRITKKSSNVVGFFSASKLNKIQLYT